MTSLISRRTFLTAAASSGISGSALAANRHISPSEETAMEKIERLSMETADVLNDCFDGQFHAVIHPSNTREFPVTFVNGRAQDSAPPPTDEEQLALCIAQLRGIFARMYPEAKISAYRMDAEHCRDRAIVVDARFPKSSLPKGGDV